MRMRMRRRVREILSTLEGVPAESSGAPLPNGPSEPLPYIGLKALQGWIELFTAHVNE